MALGLVVEVRLLEHERHPEHALPEADRRLPVGADDRDVVHALALDLAHATSLVRQQRHGDPLVAAEQHGAGERAGAVAVAHRVEEGNYNIAERHLADAIENLVARSRESLSEDRSPKNPYR